MMVAHYGEGDIQIGRLSTPGFEVSWAGDCPWRPGYCLGSDDGRIQLASVDGCWRVGPYEISPSGEAVNGVAFSDDLMAVSTRSDVTFLKVPLLGTGHVERASYFGGAHGVFATQGGGIAAPMGRSGILLMGPLSTQSQRVRVLAASDDSLYAYKLVSLSDPDRGTILACAGRRGGLSSLPLSGPGLENYGKKLRPAGVDFVDIAALGVEGFPFGAAGLGLDCSIHLVRDMLTDRTSKMMHFSPPGERAYRLLCAEGHVFLLTDKGLYAFVDLARKFLEGEAIDGLTITRKLDLEAVDVALGGDRSLLVVMPDAVDRIEIDSFISRDRKRGGGLASGMGNGSVPRLSSEESMETLDTTAWTRSEELELAGVN
jgi:hypothetical protein